MEQAEPMEHWIMKAQGGTSQKKFVHNNVEAAI